MKIEEVVTPRQFILFNLEMNKTINSKFEELAQHLWDSIPQELERFTDDFWSSFRGFLSWLRPLFFHDLDAKTDEIILIERKNLGSTTGFVDFEDVEKKFRKFSAAWDGRINIEVIWPNQSLKNKNNSIHVKIRFTVV